MTPRAAPVRPGRRGPGATASSATTRRPRVGRDDDAVPDTRAAVDGEFLSLGREENGATPVFLQ